MFQRLSRCHGYVRDFSKYPFRLIGRRGLACCSDNGDWTGVVLDALSSDPPKISDHLVRQLLLEPDKDDGNSELKLKRKNLNDDDRSPPPCLLWGFPRYPLYQEVANRLRTIQNWKAEKEKQEMPLLYPSETLKLEEIIQSEPTTLASVSNDPPDFASDVYEWLSRATDEDMLRLLGMRKTSGTIHGRLTPPRYMLLEAAALPHKPPNNILSVGARARSKHAVRTASSTNYKSSTHKGSQESFFGLAAGSQQKQNEDAHQILSKLLDEAVWINIHAFAGVDAALEVRVESGYGARWTITWPERDEAPLSVQVVFRGFLGPQMEDGHERKWRHE